MAACRCRATSLAMRVAMRAVVVGAPRVGFGAKLVAARNATGLIVSAAGLVAATEVPTRAALVLIAPATGPVAEGRCLVAAA